jgi:hypothetical protein
MRGDIASAIAAIHRNLYGANSHASNAVKRWDKPGRRRYEERALPGLNLK